MLFLVVVGYYCNQLPIRTRGGKIFPFGKVILFWRTEPGWFGWNRPESGLSRRDCPIIARGARPPRAPFSAPPRKTSSLRKTKPPAPATRSAGLRPAYTVRTSKAGQRPALRQVCKRRLCPPGCLVWSSAFSFSKIKFSNAKNSFAAGRLALRAAAFHRRLVCFLQ
jgi:hypothetical protein